MYPGSLADALLLAEGGDVSAFSRAAVTNDHKVGGFKQKEFILSRFWSPEI